MVTLLFEKLRDNQRADDYCAKRNSVPTKQFEIVFFNEVHQELDRHKGNGKRHRATDEKIADFRPRHRARFQEKFEELIRARTDHNGNGKHEGELGRRRSIYPQKQRADDGDTRAGSAGDCRQKLEATDKESVFIGKRALFRDFRCAFFVEVLDDDKGYAVQNQGAGDRKWLDKRVFFTQFFKEHIGH